jgi:ribosomal protein L20
MKTPSKKALNRWSWQHFPERSSLHKAMRKVWIQRLLNNLRHEEAKAISKGGI